MTQPDAFEDAYQPGLVENARARFVVITGCSGGGKSSLLAELARRGHSVFEEPGRQIVREQLYIGGDALPWQDAHKFVELTVSRSMHAMIEAARADRLAFFDRGIVDQVSGLEHLKWPVPAHLETAAQRFRYFEKVFVAPPWLEIFHNDAERRHSFDEAAASYPALLATYRRLEYETIEIPKTSVAMRADFVLERVAQG
jgi:predicted ATPase